MRTRAFHRRVEGTDAFRVDLSYAKFIEYYEFNSIRNYSSLLQSCGKDKNIHI